MKRSRGDNRRDLERAIEKNALHDSKKLVSKAIHAFNLFIGQPATVCSRSYGGRSDKKALVHVCIATDEFDAQCEFKVSASRKKSGHWRITNSVLRHTCDGNVKRKRGVKAEVVDSMTHGAVSSAAVLHNGSARNVQDAALEGGIQMSNSQAYAVRRRLRPHVLGAAVAEFQLLPAYFRLLQEADPSGWYKLSVKSVPSTVRQTSRFPQGLERHLCITHGRIIDIRGGWTRADG